MEIKNKKEFQYNLVQVFEHFNVLDNKEITHTASSSRCINFYKCDKSMEIVKTWLILVLQISNFL